MKAWWARMRAENERLKKEMLENKARIHVAKRKIHDLHHGVPQERLEKL